MLHKTSKYNVQRNCEFFKRGALSIIGPFGFSNFAAGVLLLDHTICNYCVLLYTLLNNAPVNGMPHYNIIPPVQD